MAEQCNTPRCSLHTVPQPQSCRTCASIAHLLYQTGSWMDTLAPAPPGEPRQPLPGDPMTQGDGSRRDQDALRRLPVPTGPWWVDNPTARTTILNEAGDQPPREHPYATTMDSDEDLVAALRPRPNGMPPREPADYPRNPQPLRSNGQMPSRRRQDPRRNGPGDQEPQSRRPRDGRPQQQVDSSGRLILPPLPEGEPPYQMYKQQARRSSGQASQQRPSSNGTGDQQQYDDRRSYSGPSQMYTDTQARRLPARSPNPTRGLPVPRNSMPPVISYALPYRTARPSGDTSRAPRPSSRRANADLYQSQKIASARRPQPRDASGPPNRDRRRTAPTRGPPLPYRNATPLGGALHTDSKAASDGTGEVWCRGGRRG